MPASGLIALLDDIASIADDVATLTAMAAKKTSGVVTDDMAVTAEQTIGIQREREIPVVVAVAKGSMFNKVVILAPGALVLNAIAPWAIMPILMAGGTFLAYEGAEKVIHKLRAHPGDEDGDGNADLPTDPKVFEQMRIDGAVRTDLILSAEIIALTLGEVATEPFAVQAATLYAISIIMTVGVYGIVGLLVKMDDFGEYLATHGGPRERIGKAIVAGAPKVLHAISIIGTVAMLMVGGHILLEGIHPLEEAVHHLLETVPSWISGLLGMVLDVLIGGVAGLIVVGVLATGIPGKLWAMLPKRKKA
jgi:predicted DNA repair protein MutK